ncbi:tRNA (guanosine(37)-N1)-methyltransferase TrmD [Desulfonatronum sp. SC1]|uniref:tRNA (guanosine(37)-N1)-methyltransferase TrmD n=1 Tax=Desulfonatronum sp. SC1 TaxID=2109626 RepID=UPI000D2F6C66|nr:tRNA (guanosine(37)-N1)-methyltransferase TrmD [Desulfonatronum sp. SC1]PTN37995.1 tRNA (guanosine(37)-N1)-methyltransferase TrmD [Desulfonatronum sp. SC1]
MQFNIVTLFPEFFASALQCGLLGKALEQETVTVRLINPRDFAVDRHRSVDDRPYGGGPGMVMTLPPLVTALRSLEASREAPGRMVLLCPKGRPLDHDLAASLAEEPVVTLICGRYEGIDHRLESLFPLEKVSVGGVVLNGGETPALHVLESVSRLLPGFMGHEESSADESFVRGLLEYPHYSRPEVFEDLRVPEILLSGDHAKVAAWRREESLRTTLESRPDLLPRAALEPGDIRTLRELAKGRRLAARNCFLALVHAPVLNKFGQSGAVSLTNLDIHDIARCSRTYGLGGYFICTPLRDQQQLANRLLGHWLSGPGAAANPDRGEALRLVSVVDGLEQAADAVAERCGKRPVLVATSAQGAGSMTYPQTRDLLEDQPVLLVLGTGYGLAQEVLEHCVGTLRPVRCFSDYNHLSVRAAAAIMLDRILGDNG